ncbi:MAG: hypothetical protein COZ25_09425 [Ignavibacteria bacterium CG_4_10_14_3_um_filter_37_18]|nr:MAG: hypothetical protein COZ25_09425 [Ignavibacteria bacterium CG_4_10_14_3_um_filter_37_18]
MQKCRSFQSVKGMKNGLHLREDFSHNTKFLTAFMTLLPEKKKDWRKLRSHQKKKYCRQDIGNIN